MGTPRTLLLFLLLPFFICVSVAFVDKSVSKAEDLALYPPRGWNSYDSYSWIINETEFLSNAEVLSKILLQYGYEYATLDFLWYRKNVRVPWNPYGFDTLDKWGRVYPDADRFPSSKSGNGLKEMVDKVHNMGLKFGLHLMTGISKQAVDANTPILDVDKGGPYEENGRVWTAKDIGLSNKACKWMNNGFMSVNTTLPAGKAFLKSLYHQYAEWGIDFVKLDCVFGDDLDTQQILAVSDILESIDHPMALSLSPGVGVTTALAEGISNHANMYRITGDDWDSWNDVVAHFDIARDFAAVNKIGAEGLRGKSWPDLDMLPLGWLTDAGVQQGPHRQCRLTTDEQRTQVTLWSMAKSPLIFGGDLTRLDGDTFGLLSNPTLLEINHHSSNNSDFPHVFSTETCPPRHLGPVLKFNHIHNYANKVVSLSDCKDDEAKGWVVSPFNRKPASQFIRDPVSDLNQELDQICWQSSLEKSIVEPYCLYKKRTYSSLDKDEQENLGNFQLLASTTKNSCLRAPISKRLSASEMRMASPQSCEGNKNELWGLNDDGTLVNGDNGLCASITTEVNGNDGGVRSWIATGRKGEIYLAFFNFNEDKTQISAKISDVLAVIGGDSSSKSSYDGHEIWSGKPANIVDGVISIMVEKHGCALFVLKRQN